MATGQAQRAVFVPRQNLGSKCGEARFPEQLRQRVTRGTELIARALESRIPPLPTAISALDRLLTGGLPRGCLIEVTGRNTSGRFSLALSTLAATTAGGDVAALIDLGDSLDPGNASELGIDLDRLLWLRPKHLKKALAAAEIALQTGFPLVILDLGEPPVRGGRGPEAAWLRLHRVAAAFESVVCVSSPYRVSGTAAATVFDAGRAQARWLGASRAPRLLETVRFDWKLEKNRHNASNERVSFALASPQAFLGEPAGPQAAAPPPPRAGATKSEHRRVSRSA